MTMCSDTHQAIGCLLRYSFAASLATLLLISQVLADQNQLNSTQVDAARIEFFEAKIRPLLVDNCYQCHSEVEGAAEGKLLLDSAAGLRQGGTRGDAIGSKSHVDASVLWRAVSYQESDMQMPPDGKLSDEELANIRLWLSDGAADPRTKEVSQEKKSLRGDAENHWAFKPPKHSETERSQQDDWSHDRIDELVFNRLHDKNLTPQKTAEPAVIFRRLCYDLTGLPPEKAELDGYLADADPEKYSKLVERLLASDAHSERMTRHWMDVVRYSDTKGYVFQEDRNYPDAYKYRDWLLRSFSQDLPFDQFVQLQLAADVLDPENQNGHHAAMGMLTLGRQFLKNQNDIADDRVDVVSRGLMALSVSCAKCHDHKYDPISTADYYSLSFAFLNSEQTDEKSKLLLRDKTDLKKTKIFERGNAHRQGPAIEPAFVKFISLSKDYPLQRGSGRIDIAEAITDPSNPLTARTYVNRVWGWMTGQPLVSTPSDFGTRCDAPVQQDVLDELAVGFIESGWSTKQLVRRIVTSKTYQQSSQYDAEAASVDPQNELLWRAPRQRMDFESLRDAMLLSTDMLSAEVGGPSEPIGNRSDALRRRTLYCFIDRQDLPGEFRAFDFANPDTHVAMRSQTTVPQQGLYLLNNHFVVNLAGKLASKVNLSDDSLDKAEIVRAVFRKVLIREPSDDELVQCAEFLATCDTRLPIRDEDMWTYGHAKVNLETSELSQFTPMPTFKQDHYQGGEKLPDATLGWCFLSAKGGHPGTSQQLAAVRRWTASADMQVRVSGSLAHPQKDGDGVIGWICKNGKPVTEQSKVHDNKSPIKLDSLTVEKGDTLDFIVDSNQSISSDSFEWMCEIKDVGDSTRLFRSKRMFVPPQPSPTNATQQLIQALLMTNEFCFID